MAITDMKDLRAFAESLGVEVKEKYSTPAKNFKVVEREVDYKEKFLILQGKFQRMSRELSFLHKENEDLKEELSGVKRDLEVKVLTVDLQKQTIDGLRGAAPTAAEVRQSAPLPEIIEESSISENEEVPSRGGSEPKVEECAAEVRQSAPLLEIIEEKCVTTYEELSGRQAAKLLGMTDPSFRRMCREKYGKSWVKLSPEQKSQLLEM